VATPGLATSPAGYQACVLPQCGQPTEVETGASKTNPQRQLYIARSGGGPASRRRRDGWFCVGAAVSGRAGAAFCAGSDLPSGCWRESRRRRILRVPDLDLANTFMTSNGSIPNWFRRLAVLSLALTQR
jgi:hypothetical protein